MIKSFILANVNETAFWDRSYEGDPGVCWLKDCFPNVHQWLEENAVKYSILFEYVSPIAVGDSLQIRIEIEDDSDAVLFRLTWG